MSGSTSPVSPVRSFRDPAGSLEVRDDSVWRRVYSHAMQETLDLFGSSFYKGSEARGDVVGSQIREQSVTDGLLLEHPRVFFPSYCWEWAPSQWVAAGELTLTLCEAALAEGWILKDATPLNILFEGHTPVLVDVLSFERRNPRSALFTAQAQFIRTFLLSLIARYWLGRPLSATQSRRDGLSPEELYPYMRIRAFTRPLLLRNVGLPTLFDRHKPVSEESIEATKSREYDPEIATVLLQRTLRSLRSQLTRARGPAADSRWSAYEDNLAHYGQMDQQAKQHFVGECVAKHRPQTVLDVGTNTGFYALLAAKHGARVVALDTDEASVEQLYRKAVAANADVQPLVGNLARPTPAVGWRNEEQLSFLDRAAGRFEMVMMLAVIHHLLLTEQIPLSHLAELSSRLTFRWLLVEWVPGSDPMFRQLLRGRSDLYGHLTETAFVQAFSEYFRVEHKGALGNGRVLYLFEKSA
jgi:2-polyprenyl-3-methyl-5-hydroxy-6-metoxy-1,4-benzoquinol methylase